MATKNTDNIDITASPEGNKSAVRYKGKDSTKVANELFDKSYRTKLSLHGQKLLYGLASGLSDDTELFPRWSIRIQDLFKYLNLSPDNNSRHDAVREAFSNILHSPLEYNISPKRWGGMQWLSYYKFDEENSDFIEVEIYHGAKPFLLQLKNYCLLEAKYFAKFTSKYAMFFYTRLRAIANQKKATLELTFDEIVTLTHNDKKKSYQAGPDRNTNILQRICGIERKKGQDCWLPTTEQDKITGVEVEVGAIAEINAISDIYVTCEVVKAGRSFDSIIFYVVLKAETYQGKRKLIRKAHRTDFRDSSKKTRVIEEIKTGELFPASVPMDTVKMVAESMGLSVEAVMRKHGYRPSADGKHALPI